MEESDQRGGVILQRKNLEDESQNMQHDIVWYFAYGSNLSIPQMLSRVGEWQTSRKANLKGWKLIFNVDSEKWGKGAANIVETKDPNDIVRGVIYLIKKEKLCVLSTYEGVLPKEVTVKSEGKDIKARTYIFRKDKKPTNPPKGYLQTIIDGLRQHGYDEDDVKQIHKAVKAQH